MSVPPESVVPPTPPGEPPLVGVPSAEERQWALFAHLSALLGLVIPFGSIFGPLVIWLIKKDTMPFVNDQAKEALNFNITVALASLVLLVLSIITFGIGLIIAIPMWIIIGVAWLVLTIVAAVKANEGVRYRYPFALRFIK
jgi:uncharacterized Tic20 family protein